MVSQQQQCSAPGCNNPAETDVKGEPLCSYHAKLAQGTPDVGEKRRMHPTLIMQHSPLASMILNVTGAKEVHRPRDLKTSSKESEWTELVGFEPKEDLKKNKELAISAQIAEDYGAITAPQLAQELVEHEEIDMEQRDERKARRLLDRLADLDIVNKKSKQGPKGANLYDYGETEIDWRKEE